MREVPEYSAISDSFANISAGGHNYEKFPTKHTDRPNSCEMQEWAVTSFLWDLYDNGTEHPETISEPFDNIALGDFAWWDCTTQSGTYTLTDFVSLMDQQYPNMRNDIGALLGAHQIAPGNLKIMNSSAVANGTATPRLTWTVNGSVDHPNNQFEVVFFDVNNNYIRSSPLIASTQQYTATFTYTVPDWVWDDVIEHYYSVAQINIAVRGYQTDNPLSGPYMSKYATAIVTDISTVNMHSSDPYIEKIVSIAKGSYCDMPLSFSTSGIKLLQTFGTFDTKMELYSSTGTLLASNDDGGYGTNAFIRYDCQANTEYTIRLRFYSSTTAGTIKFAVTPAPWLLHSGSTALDTYEDIYTVSNRTSFNLSTTAAPNRTKVLTFKAPSAGSYTFELRSDFDTYIHVIDPRSGAPLVYNVNYNDDCYEGTNQLDAKLTVELDQNIPYLVIYSAFNPGSLTESLPMNVIITKNDP